MIALQRLHEMRVHDAQIDHLGHMNVRFYLELAIEATRALAAAHGLTPQACREQGVVLEVRDAFTRHYREQLAGAPLAVMGGILAVRAEGLRVYHELVNDERDERAAVFVHELVLVQRETRRPLLLPEMLVKSAGDARVEWPEHGRPRTLDLEPRVSGPTLEVVRQRGLAMRLPRRVQKDECDIDGYYLASRYHEMVWAGEPVAGRVAGMPFFELEDGAKCGWATLESRATLHRLPRAGAHIQAFGAELELTPKTSTRRHWVFDLDSGELLFTHSILNLAFDIGKRRATLIPSHVRAYLEDQHHPDLR